MLSLKLSNVLRVGIQRPWVRVAALPLFYWVATLGKLFTDIA